MKKKILVGLFFVIFGFSIGRVFFMKIKIPSFHHEGEKYYFLQEGVYYHDDKLTNLKQKVLEYKDDRIYVYSAITKDLEVAEKLLNIYNQNNIQLSIKEKYLKNEELKNNIEQFDLLIRESNDIDEIMKIEEVVLANYEEIIKNR